MTDQQRLRDALQDAVPEPPLETWQGTSIRAHARRARRIRMTLAAGMAGAVAVAGAALWASRPHESGSNVTGSSAATCNRLLRDVNGSRYVDSRLVDGPTVARWLEQVPLHLDPAKYRHDGRVAVCLASGRTAYVIYLLAGHGDEDRVPIYGLYGKGGAAQTMAALDRLRTGGQKTTDAPFTCSGPPTEHYLDVTTSLPEGATAARICFHGLFFTPPQVLTSGVATLVADVNAAPIGYSSPDFNCSGAEGDYPYTIIFRYPHGTRSVSEETCRGLILGGVHRETRGLDHTFLSLLRQQVGVSPGSMAAPPCPASSADRPAGVGDLHNVVAARYCVAGGGAGRELTRSQLSLLRDWGRSLLGATTEPEHRCTRPAMGWPRLSLADAWGNPFTVVLVGCGRRLFPAAVNWGATDKVIYPLGDINAVARLARQLGHGAP